MEVFVVLVVAFFWYIFSQSSSGKSRPGNIREAFQRGNQVEIVREDGSVERVYGELRGWSSSSVNFIDESGDSTSISASGAWSRHY